MGFISDKDIDGRLESPDNLVNRLSIHQIKRGRSEGAIEVPIEIKKTIAILGNEGAKQTEVAKAFGLHQTTVSSYERGEVGNQYTKNKELAPVIATVRERIRDNRELAESHAIANLLSTLEVLPREIATDKKLKRAKAISGIAKDMAIIANQMSDKNTNPDGSKAVHLHLYAPRQKQVNEYETIDI